MLVSIYLEGLQIYRIVKFIFTITDNFNPHKLYTKTLPAQYLTRMIHRSEELFHELPVNVVADEIVFLKDQLSMRS